MLNLVIFGPPGSGKGTQAVHIQNKYGLIPLSTGEMLRQEVAAQSDLSQIVSDCMASGQLVPDEMISQILKKAIKNNLAQGNGFIFDGFPRNGEQAQILENILKELGMEIGLAINLSASDPELIRRIILRGHSSGRIDDNEEVVKERLIVYRDNVNDLLDFYQKRNLLKEINGEGTPQEVFDKIIELIDKI